MPIIKGPEDLDMVAVTFRMPENLRDEIKEYCKWAGPYKDGYFYVSALRYVLAHDKEWQKELSFRKKKKPGKAKKTRS